MVFGYYKHYTREMTKVQVKELGILKDIIRSLGKNRVIV